MIEWTQKARTLADQLHRSGELRTPQWAEAIRRVPRHHLVESYYVQNTDGSWVAVDGSSTEPGDWLDTIYSDTTLITTLADTTVTGGPGPVAVSSSTMPGLMVSMLEALQVRDGHRVLEIGTGSGYNAALLSYRLGSHNVFSVDVDTDLVHRARIRLADLGYTPTLHARDGERGLTEHAPFDRIISTCAVPAIPRPWIEQTRLGGLILTDFKPSGLAGNLVLLERRHDSASGRFLPIWAGFMTMRHGNPGPAPRPPRRDHTGARNRATIAPPQPWTQPVPWFLAQFAMPDDLTCSQIINDSTGQPDATVLSTADGSWCEVTSQAHNGTNMVRESGPVALWALFEHAHEQWLDNGKPDWERLGLTVTPDSHVIWLDDPTSTTSWTLSR